MKVIDMGEMALLPCDTSKGQCEACAVKHNPDEPHNQQSMYYQYWFRQRHKRWPTWKDAMAHCNAKMKKLWKEGLREHGVKI